MVFNFTEAELIEMVSRFVWPFLRVSGFMLAIPVFGTRVVSPRIRIGLTALIALVIAPMLPAVPQVDLLSVRSYVMAAEQLLIGVSMAFMMQILFQIFILAGQMIAMQMGLGFASMVDPSNGIFVAIISQFYLTLTTLVFLSMNGHLVAIEILVESFYVMPVSTQWQLGGFFDVATAGSWMFASALFVALPAVAAILVVNFAFGVMTRAAPQMNIISIGFPFTMMIGLFVMWVSLSGFLPQYERLVSESLILIKNMYAL
jgi:flagellar biosynthetic protein FliR